MATVALAWVLKNPVVDTPIIGATKRRSTSPTPAAALELTLSEEDTVRSGGSLLLRVAVFGGRGVFGDDDAGFSRGVLI